MSNLLLANYEFQIITASVLHIYNLQNTKALTFVRVKKRFNFFRNGEYVFFLINIKIGALELKNTFRTFKG
jgi:hypothetical protein